MLMLSMLCVMMLINLMKLMKLSTRCTLGLGLFGCDT